MSGPDDMALERLLAATRDALRAGDIVRLGVLAAGIEAAIKGAAAMEPSQARRLRAMAEVNERLLRAALKGVRAARQRVGELSDRGRFSTYDARGQRHQPGLAPGGGARRV